MNDNILKLMHQAGYSASELESRAHKLAELIVRDCAKIADIAEPYRSQDLILEYFGVKK